jgi:hypothetical protein
MASPVWPFTTTGRPHPVMATASGLGGRLGFHVVSHGGHRSAPRVIAALAGLVHDRQSATDYECNQDNDSCYGGVHCNLPFELSLKYTRTTRHRLDICCGAQQAA